MAKQLVVVGGGYAGMTLLKEWGGKEDFEVTLVEPCDKFLHAVTTVRGLVDPKMAEAGFIPYKGLLKKGSKHIRQKVTNLHPGANTVTLDNGETLLYDYLVLAMGVSYAEPFRFDYSDSGEELPSVAACAKMAALRNRISEKAKTVVVGGGVTGIEVACEIIEAFPGKEVTLVHSRPRLLNDEPRASDKDAAAIKLKLEKKGITVTLNTRYDFDAAPDDTAVIRAAGGKPATQFLDPTMLDDKGFVKVDDYLRLNDHPNIFVAGDLISGRPKKVVNSTMLTAPVVMNNIMASAKGSKLKKCGDLPSAVFALSFSLGKGECYGHWPLGKFFGFMKRTNMFLPMYHGMLKYKPKKSKK